MGTGTSKDRPAAGEAGTAPAERWPVTKAAGWIDAHVAALDPEEVPLAAAGDRVLAATVSAPHDLPPADRAARDGIALRADETAGAGAYNPLTFRLVAPAATLTPGTAVRLHAGAAMPAGADAVVPLEHLSPSADDRCEIIEPVAPGHAVMKAGSHARRGAALIATGRRLLPHHLGLLAEAGLAQVQVVRRPRAIVLLTRRPEVDDADGPMLQALIERDGGTVAERRAVDRDHAAIAEALRAARADVVLVVGGTGPGPDDRAASALAAAGTVAAQGVALAPGETAAFGRTGAGVPVFLLPGAPADCLWAYEFLAGRAVRRLGGRDPALPFPARAMTAARKLVSAIGRTEVVAVRQVAAGTVEPAAAFGEAGLAAAARADGFVVIAEGSEGVAAGASLTVYLYNQGDAAEPGSR